MNYITIENKKYIIGDIVLTEAPIYSKGSRSARDLIKKKGIENDKFIYARKVGDKLVVSDGKSAKMDKVFFTKEFIISVPELNKENNEKITDDSGVMKAPNIIYLKDEEKFKDDNGKVIEIETRGERAMDTVYFKVKDVMVGFEMENLYKNIIDKDTQYTFNKDYKYFMCNIFHNLENKTSKKTDTKAAIKKELFLTYRGILRCLFVSRNNKTDNFIDWATKTLFIAQMGTTEQKDMLVSKIKGVSYKAIQELFSINAREMPCVYLTAFNTVGVLRNEMNIDMKYKDEDIVYKFGLTKSFEARKNGHKSEYKKIDNLIDMKLVQYTYIDPLYIAEAENEIKNMLEEYKITWENHDELVVIPNNMLKFINTIYSNIGMKYSGHTQEFMNKIHNLEMHINSIKKDQEYQKIIFEEKLNNKEEALKNKDLIIEVLKKDLRIKELELMLKNNISYK
jgi:hypothetical protein